MNTGMTPRVFLQFVRRVRLREKIKVCDAIMGSGKTSAAITYMNEHPDKRFIFVTPYLEEAERIRVACPTLHFVKPSNKIPDFRFTKYRHALELMREGKNIATTHQAFKMYTDDTATIIKKMGYTLIIDESVDVYEAYTYNPQDVTMLVSSGYIREGENGYEFTDKQYDGGAFDSFVSKLKQGYCMNVNPDNPLDGHACWVVPVEVMESFRSVYILTYLFEAQGLYRLFRMKGVKYKKIGVEIDNNGVYRFGEYDAYIPPYTRRIRELIEILDDEAMNRVGEPRTALSMAWMKRSKRGMGTLRQNLIKYFKEVNKDVPIEERMWGTANAFKDRLSGKGYTKKFVNAFTRGVNTFRNRTCLAYPINIYMNVSERLFYKKRGVDVNQDMYALSVMVQWIWRSAVRDGKKIKLYLPSSRMRRILSDWMDDISKEDC